MNIEQLMSQEYQFADVMILTKVMVDIDPKIAIKKVKVINMILVIYFLIIIKIGTN